MFHFLQSRTGDVNISDYDININHAVFPITYETLVKTTPQGVNLLKDEYDRKIRWDFIKKVVLNSKELDASINKFSEQLIFYAENELINWFSYTKGRIISTKFPDLYYLIDKNYEINISAVAAIGEGIAGHILEEVFGYNTLARPLKYMPDIIMEKK
jgi:hypothetical protein